MGEGRNPDPTQNTTMTIAYAKFTIFAQDKDWNNAEESLKVTHFQKFVELMTFDKIMLHALGSSGSRSVRTGNRSYRYLPQRQSSRYKE
jgi:hypothetical protein